MEAGVRDSRIFTSFIPDSVSTDGLMSVLRGSVLSSQSVLYVLCTLLLAVLCHCVLTITGLIWKRRRMLKAVQGFSGPKPHWLFGNMRDMVRSGDILGFQTKLAEKFPGGCLFLFGPLVMVRTHRPDFVKCIMTAEPKSKEMYRFLEPWTGNGLLLSSGQKWARNRRLLTPAFHFDILKPYIPIFSESATTLVQKWKTILGDTEQSLELFSPVSMMTLDSLMKCIFGFHGDCQSSEHRHPYTSGVRELAELITRRFRNPLLAIDDIFHLTWSGYQFRRARRTVHSYSRKVITERRHILMNKDASEKPSRYLDFLDMLLSAKDEDGVGLTDSEIQAEVDTFMFAGHDTTASAVSWCLYNLATHPEYQEKCRDEVNNVLGERQHFAWEDMQSLPFLTMCIKESLRRHPPVPNVGRQTTKPTAFPNGVTVPPGVDIVVGVYACHHNPEVWENPEVYDPYRFTSENCKGRSPHAFIPFSAGPRNCIGQHFALHEIRVSVGQVLRHFDISEDTTKKVMPIPLLALRSANGIFIKLKPRQI